ncbi:hypothetical protein HG535_0F00780 [Zygotorulaspora mrakii]|uniref:Uncharacterized protein n=1 Tax=Zygotorulaspora mrakii TaxID=42260 RepID=A0A7H9B4F3_ZYGMR|nr:uncharacterized protein HG535_0F00780 [Zygotorulaspora mrakii]QLG73568.1 hypothetical protein HG535_0F00780 [Zygotorulaspora mrakii]
MYTTPSNMSTPPRLRPLSIPTTPTKKVKATSLKGKQAEFTPSKAPRKFHFMRKEEPFRGIGISELLPSLANIILNQSIKNEKAPELDEIESPYAFESDNTLSSDIASFNLSSDSSSIPSSSPEFEEFSFAEPWVAPSMSKINDMALNLSRIYHSSFLPSIENSGSKTAVPYLKHRPCHRIKKPGRPILRLHSGSLNLLVSSSSGSLEDATIFATEINASLASPEGEKIPCIKNSFEKVTIPVNSSVKERQKKNRKKLLGECYESESESECTNQSDTSDAAFIKGFEIKLDEDREKDFEKRVNEIKSVQWAKSLML